MIRFPVTKQGQENRLAAVCSSIAVSRRTAACPLHSSIIFAVAYPVFPKEINYRKMKIVAAVAVAACFGLSQSSCKAQTTHPNAPVPGTYSSSMSTSWVTVTPKLDANPGKTKPAPVNYGVGSTSFKGLFGDLILKSDGTYTLTKDTHGGTWGYDAAKDSVIFTGWLSTFKTRYHRDKNWITIYTGDVKMPDGNTLNITYTKSVAKEE